MLAANSNIQEYQKIGVIQLPSGGEREWKTKDYYEIPKCPECGADLIEDYRVIKGTGECRYTWWCDGLVCRVKRSQYHYSKQLVVVDVSHDLFDSRQKLKKLCKKRSDLDRQINQTNIRISELEYLKKQLPIWGVEEK